MTLRLVVAALLALAAIVLVGLSVLQWRDGRATGARLALAVGGSLAVLVCAGGVAISA